MDELRKGEQLLVITLSSDGLELRREPTMNPETADGKDNVILFMPPDSFVALESVEVRINDGHSWYNVRYVQEEIDETGWAIGESLQIAFQIPVTGAPDSPATSIQYNGNSQFGGQSVWLLNYPPKVLGSVGLVTFKIGPAEFATTIGYWNVAVNDNRFQL